MSVSIKLKHSSQSGKSPNAGNLTAGEIALNTADVKAYMLNDAGEVVTLVGNDSPIDDRYVDVDGDNMTGDLTLGTDKITLDASSGNATFDGGIYPNGIDSSEGITSRDGFHGRVALDNSAILLGFEWNTDNVTSQILESGAAEFAGTITSGDVTSGSDYNFDARSTSYALRVFNHNLTPSAPGNPSLGNFDRCTAIIRESGAATFAGQITSGGTWGVANLSAAVSQSGFGVRRDDGGAIFTAYRNAYSAAGETIKFSSNGNAFCAGEVSTNNIYVVTAAVDTQACLAVKRNGVNKILFTGNGTATFAGNITAPNVSFNLEPDDEDNYTTTTEEYTETETYTVEVPVIETGVGTADLVDGDERETRTVTREREVTKTREIKTYTGPTMDVKEQLLAYEARFKQQDAVIAQMTSLLKGLGADVSTLPALEGVTKKSTKKK